MSAVCSTKPRLDQPRTVAQLSPRSKRRLYTHHVFEEDIPQLESLFKRGIEQAGCRSLKKLRSSSDESQHSKNYVYNEPPVPSSLFVRAHPPRANKSHQRQQPLVQRVIKNQHSVAQSNDLLARVKNINMMRAEMKCNMDLYAHELVHHLDDTTPTQLDMSRDALESIIINNR